MCLHNSNICIFTGLKIQKLKFKVKANRFILNKLINTNSNTSKIEKIKKVIFFIEKSVYLF